MRPDNKIDPHLRDALIAEGIDVDLSFSLLNRINNTPPQQTKFTPVSTHQDIICLTEGITASKEQCDNLITAFPDLQCLSYLHTTDEVYLNKKELEEIGGLLFPYYSYGMLNGGSASSYADATKNAAYSSELFTLYKDQFEHHAPSLRDLPKSLAPALYLPSGPAPPFLAFKFRMIRTAFERYTSLAQQYGLHPTNHKAPVFQMLSTKNSAAIRNAQPGMLQDDFCASSLWQADILDAEQSLIATITQGDSAHPRTIFQDAFGSPGRPYGLPGGHGQNFHVLKDVYTSLYTQGIRFISIGNIDNLGYTIDPKTLAYLALSQAASLYEFSPRTELDKKGGILVANEAGELSCADLGVAIDPSCIASTDQVYFNCATGWFNLEFLLGQLDTIIANLPIRVSNQHKDAGKYAQIELVTWEAMPHTKPLKVLQVEKKERLLSAKMLLETFILSGIHIESAAQSTPFAHELHTACKDILHRYYAVQYNDL